MATTLEIAARHKPGSRTVTVRYGRVQTTLSGVTPKRHVWGFDISDKTATEAWYTLYSSSRPHAKKLYETTILPNAIARNFKVKLIVDADSGLNSDLTRIRHLGEP